MIFFLSDPRNGNGSHLSVAKGRTWQSHLPLRTGCNTPMIWMPLDATKWTSWPCFLSDFNQNLSRGLTFQVSLQEKPRRRFQQIWKRMRKHWLPGMDRNGGIYTQWPYGPYLNRSRCTGPRFMEPISHSVI